METLIYISILIIWASGSAIVSKHILEANKYDLMTSPIGHFVIVFFGPISIIVALISILIYNNHEK